MKLPGINVGGLGRFHNENLPRPNYQALGEAIGNTARAVANLVKTESDADLNEAIGSAAQELSLLRAKLETSRAIPTNEIPDEIPHEVHFKVVDSSGNVREVGKPFVYAHEIADEWWATKSQEILATHAESIANEDKRAEFYETLMTRYVAPGSQAIAQASIIKGRAYDQAMAQDAVDQVLASDAPTEVREEQAREIIDRQVAQGADPTWAAQQREQIGPRVDQIDFQNRLMKANSTSEVQTVVEDMWIADHRMSPETMRTLNAQADKQIQEFEAARKRKHTETGAELTSMFFENRLSVDDINAALEADDLDRPTAMILYNALQSGNGAANATDPFTLSKYRGEIIKLPYTGGNNTVSGKAEFLKLMINSEAMGLTPLGTPTGRPPAITGTDAATLNKEIDAKVKATLRGPDFKDGWEQIKEYTQIQDMFGSILGDQKNVNAAMAFKKALMRYMDQYGLEADPIAFFESNKATYHPDNFEDPINQEFVELYPPAVNFMTQNPDGTYTFPVAQQRAFISTLTAGATSGTIEQERAEEVAARFMAYYRGQGVAPPGTLALDDDHPLYHQFEQTQ